MTKTVGAAEFKAKCLRLINDMHEDGEPVIITKRGCPVAVLTPEPKTDERASVFGALRGSVLAYEEPFLPAADAADWAAAQ